MQYITDTQVGEMRAVLVQGGIIEVLSDLDGTTCELNRKNPFAVSMNPTARDAFAHLSWMPQVEAGILTGRDIAFAQKLVGQPGLLYIGHHGQGQTRQYPARLDDVTFVPEVVAYKEKTQRLLAQAKEVLPRWVILEPKGISLALNVGGCSNPGGTVQEIERELRSFAEGLGFKWTHDITTVEFLPDVPERDKGAALLDAVGSSGAQYTVFGGDSMTDMSALLAIKRLHEQSIGGIGVVAEREDTRPELLAAADLRVPGVPGMATFLAELVEVLRA